MGTKVFELCLITPLDVLYCTVGCALLHRFGATVVSRAMVFWCGILLRSTPALKTSMQLRCFGDTPVLRCYTVATVQIRRNFGSTV